MGTGFATPEGSASAGGARPSILGRLDRLPVWPYRRTLLWVVGAGYFFAFFDIVNIGYALPVISQQFHISSKHASIAITTGLIGYIVGAYADSTIADRWGRKLSLGISVALFTAGSIGAAASPDLAWLAGWRFVAGLGIGAEIASVTAYLGELSPAPLRGRYTSWATTAAYAGFAVVPFIARGLVPTLHDGWRILFYIGAAGGLTILIMRRGLTPSPRWLEAHGRHEEAERVVAEAERIARERMGGEELPPPADTPPEEPIEKFPTLALLRPPYRSRVLLFLAIWFVYYIGNYGWLTLAPDLLTSKGYDLSESIEFLLAAGVGFLVGALITTRLSDRFERKWSILAVAVAWAVCLIIIGVFVSAGIVIAFGFLASVTIGLLVPMLYTLTGEHFTTAARATGVALTDGVGHVGGAIAPYVVLAASSFLGSFAIMAATGLVTAALLPLAIRATARPLEQVA